MNSHEPVRKLDWLDLLVRASLRRSVAGQLPSPDVRRRLLRRAADQQRRRPEILFDLGIRPSAMAHGLSAGQGITWNQMADFTLLHKIGPVGALHLQIR